ncbi:MAG: hypothetical protein JKY61_04140 [Planctomycetes bacterium]|nr:hypothetical protein [Planctomycetota bacterium]
MTTPAGAPTPTYKFFRGQFVWTGALFFLGALIATEVAGGQIGFHGFSMFGGWFLGIGFERNRSADALARSRGDSE